MPDIAMCKGTGCPYCDRCYRYKATASQRQSYFLVPPYNKDTHVCDHYWEIDSPDEVHRLNVSLD